jgi:hypothetical protein
MKGDRAVVRIAAVNDPCAIKYASEQLKGDPEFAGMGKGCPEK